MEGSINSRRLAPALGALELALGVTGAVSEDNVTSLFLTVALGLDGVIIGSVVSLPFPFANPFLGLSVVGLGAVTGSLRS